MYVCMCEAQILDASVSGDTVLSRVVERMFASSTTRVQHYIPLNQLHVYVYAILKTISTANLRNLCKTTSLLNQLR